MPILKRRGQYHDDEPDLPINAGNARRMAKFDSFPKEIRCAINNAEMIAGVIDQVALKLRSGIKVKTIVNWIENQSLKKVSRSPAERDAAAAFLKSIGID